MKTLLMYYSYTGTTKALCETLAGPNIDMREVKELKERSAFNAYVFGGYGALRKKPSKIQPVKIDTSPYDLVIVAFPIWANSMPPAAVALFEQLNVNNKKVVLVAVSYGDTDYTEKLKPVVEGAGGKLINIYNVKKGDGVEIKELKKA